MKPRFYHGFEIHQSPGHGKPHTTQVNFMILHSLSSSQNIVLCQCGGLLKSAMSTLYRGQLMHTHELMHVATPIHGFDKD